MHGSFFCIQDKISAEIKTQKIHKNFIFYETVNALEKQKPTIKMKNNNHNKIKN